MFFDQSGSFIVEMCLFTPPKLYSIFGVDRVNLSKVLFILLFLILCKLAKNL